MGSRPKARYKGSWIQRPCWESERIEGDAETKCEGDDEDDYAWYFRNPQRYMWKPRKMRTAAHWAHGMHENKQRSPSYHSPTGIPQWKSSTRHSMRSSMTDTTFTSDATTSSSGNGFHCWSGCNTNDEDEDETDASTKLTFPDWEGITYEGNDCGFKLDNQSVSSYTFLESLRPVGAYWTSATAATLSHLISAFTKLLQSGRATKMED